MEESVRYLQDLLRFDTTNPPGNELPAAQYLAGILQQNGYDPQILESTPGRGNVIARHRGSGERAPLLLYGHLDVVRAEAEYWRHPPFGGEHANGCLWGRGALDMKCTVVQALMVMLLIKRDGLQLRRDVIFAATADEEAGGRAGMGYLVDHHPDLIRAEFGLSEGGGTTTYMGGKPVYDVRTAEKGTCRFVLRARGAPGHGSVPRPDTAVGRIAEAVTRLIATPLPFRALPMLAPFFQIMGESLHLPPAHRQVSENTVRAVSRSLPALGQYLHAITHDTAVPTGLRAGHKINVIPSEAEAWIDGRYLPGQTVDGFLAEIRQVIGDDYEIEPIDLSLPLAESPNGPLFDAIRTSMGRHAPGTPIVPLLLSGATDAKHVTRLGTRCLGFSPVKVPEDFPAEQLVHGHDERIPIEGFSWGVPVLYDIVRTVCG